MIYALSIITAVFTYIYIYIHNIHIQKIYNVIKEHEKNVLINDFATPKSYLLFQSSVVPPKYFEFRILKLVMKPNNRGNCECDASY